MDDMIRSVPDIFWIFAGIALVILASGYVKNTGKGASSKEIEDIKQRLDRIEQHLDLRN